MTEIEKIAYAKEFLDRLADGVSPIDGTAIPEGDIVNNVRVSRCLFFVSDVLRQVIENGGINKKRYSHLEVTPEQLAHFRYSDTPLKVSEIIERVKECSGNEKARLSAQRITNWLVSIGALAETSDGYTRRTRVPTESGSELGLIGEDRTTSSGEVYCMVRYSRKAQEFIIDNFEAILNA